MIFDLLIHAIADFCYAVTGDRFFRQANQICFDSQALRILLKTSHTDEPFVELGKFA